MSLAENVELKFKELFDKHPLIIRSPGRVNLIGEHTDYNMGFVLPAAIDKAVYFAITPGNNDECILFALDLNEEFRFNINNMNKSDKGWPNYLMGVVEQLIISGYKLKGFNCVFGGDIPIGAGLSSSARLRPDWLLLLIIYLIWGLIRFHQLKWLKKLKMILLALNAELWISL